MAKSMRRFWRILLLLFLLGGAYIAGSALTQFIEQQLPNWSNPNSWLFLLLLGLLYSLLLSIPFVPGVELGWALLMLLGAKGLIIVYPATVIGLSLSFLLGSWIPLPVLERLLGWLHLHRAEQILRHAESLDSHNRLAMLLTKAPQKILPVLLRHRYLALAIAFNLPGNSVIGGGGGIALLAGLSRLYSFSAFVLLVSIAIMPIPATLILWELNN